METHPPFSPRNFSFFFLGHFHESLKTTCYFLLPSLSPLPTIHVQKHLQVLNWDVVQAVTPPVEQIILSTDKVKIEINNKRGAREEKSTTCCFCCDSASPPKQNSSDGQKPKSSLKAGPSASRINSTTGAGSSTSKGARSSSPKGARSSSTKGAGSSSGR